MSSRSAALIALLPVAGLLLTGCNVVTGGRSAASDTQEAAPVSPGAESFALAPFAGEVGMGVSYLQTRVADLKEAVDALVLAIESENLDAAKRAYYEARAPYEEIQVMAPVFPELDLSIDGRASDFDGGELSDEFRGFHRIESFLFARENTKSAIPYALELVEDVDELQMIFADRGLFDAETTFEALVVRCDELASRTITSEEETWSDQTLLVIKHAWTGIHSQYRHFGRDLREKDVVLAERLDRVYRQAMELIAADFPMGQTEGGPYTLVDRAKRRRIADASIKLRLHIQK
ncbi:MAG: EfeM/EfeO family lipoprotein, partial [Planctomycetota bacterium]